MISGSGGGVCCGSQDWRRGEVWVWVGFWVSGLWVY